MEDLKENETLDSEREVSRQPSVGRGHELFAPARPVSYDGEMMGPILRRKKVVSLPLGRGGTNQGEE